MPPGAIRSILNANILKNSNSRGLSDLTKHRTARIYRAVRILFSMRQAVEETARRYVIKLFHSTTSPISAADEALSTFT